MRLSSVSQPAQVTDTDRNFCFKVTSPVRILILQAESTQGKTDNEASIVRTILYIPVCITVWFEYVLIVEVTSLLT